MKIENMMGNNLLGEYDRARKMLNNDLSCQDILKQSKLIYRLRDEILNRLNVYDHHSTKDNIGYKKR